jgi:hypothetical protein
MVSHLGVERPAVEALARSWRSVAINVDHVTVFRWVQRFTPLLIDAARPCRHAPGDRWFVDETYVKTAGRCLPVPGDRPVRAGDRRVGLREAGPGRHPAILHPRTRAWAAPRSRSPPTAATYPRVLDELVPVACHVTEQYANIRIEADHGRRTRRQGRGESRLVAPLLVAAPSSPWGVWVRELVQTTPRQFLCRTHWTTPRRGSLAPC